MNLLIYDEEWEGKKEEGLRWQALYLLHGGKRVSVSGLTKQQKKPCSIWTQLLFSCILDFEGCNMVRVKRLHGGAESMNLLLEGWRRRNGSFKTADSYTFSGTKLTENTQRNKGNYYLISPIVRKLPLLRCCTRATVEFRMRLNCVLTRSLITRTKKLYFLIWVSYLFKLLTTLYSPMDEQRSEWQVLLLMFMVTALKQENA